MAIWLDKDWRIEVDDIGNWTLIETRHHDEKEHRGKMIAAHDRDETIGYFRSFGQAIEEYLRLRSIHLDEVSEVTIREYVERVELSNKTCLKAFKRVREDKNAE